LVVAAGLCGLLLPVHFAPPAAAADTYLEEADDAAGLLPEMNLVPVTSPEVDLATARIRDNLGATAAEVEAQSRAEGRLQDLAAGRTELEHHGAELEVARDAATARATEAAGRRAGHEAEAAALQRVLDEVAAMAYIGGGDQGDLLSSPGFTEAGRRARYADDVFNDVLGRRRAELAERDRAAADEAAARAEEAHQVEALAANGGELEANTLDTSAAQAERDAAVTGQTELAAELQALKTSLATARRSARVMGADFPLVVLDAFRRATEHEAEARPGCSLDWQLLAGISKIESNHGTYGGSKVSAAGDTSIIVGPRLDGSPGVASIADTDGGKLDGDPTYDRAVGPMQFIPSSWKIFGGDGNGDGVSDPRNFYDAALAAAEHLCRAGYDVSTPDGFRRAVLGYNNSEEYVGAVTLSMNRYRGFTW
jgi:membrane-bound lytic murein transglycosylase B